MKQQPMLGFFLATIAAGMWGVLPIALQQVLQVMDSETAVWYRFAVSAVGLFLVLAMQRKLPVFSGSKLFILIFVVMGLIGLLGNFWLYNVALTYIPATTTQIISPLAFFAMLAAGVFVFKEKIYRYQKIGLVLVILGLIFFFNERLSDFLHINQYVKGVVIALAATLIWVAYGIAQKKLLIYFSSSQILLLIYWGCALLSAPFATVSQIQALNGWQLACLIFCCLNTLIAYGCYGEALNRWEVSKVSAIMTQIPIFTLVFSHLSVWIAPHFFPAVELNGLSYFGALVVVLGSLLSAIGQNIVPYFKWLE